VAGNPVTRNTPSDIRVRPEEGKKMKKKNELSFGAVCAEVIVLGGAKRAATLADLYGRPDLAEKIRWGQFTAPTGGYNATRARARAVAMKLLAA